MRFRVFDILTREYSKDRNFNIDIEGRLFYGNARFPSGEVEYSIGVKDQNGIEIYSGDIVANEKGDKRTVLFGSNIYSKLLGGMQGWEIIGNINQIDELIRGK